MRRRRKYPNKEQTIVEVAQAMIDYNWSCMQIQKKMFIPHSTAHRWLKYELKYIDDDLFVQCKNILKKHKKTRW